jgi:hypothetical protein
MGATIVGQILGFYLGGRIKTDTYESACPVSGSSSLALRSPYGPTHTNRVFLLPAGRLAALTHASTKVCSAAFGLSFG